MRVSSSVRILARHMRTYAGFAILPLAAVLLLFNPALAAGCLLVLSGVLLWERLHLRHSADAMRDALRDDQDLKLEVSGGILGDLTHHINRLRQHYRNQQRLLHLLGVPDAAVAAQLTDLEIPPSGRPCNVVVLALRPPSGEQRSIEQLHAIALAAQQQARQYGAILNRVGESVLLIFGAFEQSRPERHLRSAHQAAIALHQQWTAASGNAKLTLSLAAGSAEVVILPGMGYSILGAPIDQALLLLNAGQPDTLVCSEPTYIYLRRLGSAPPLSVAPRLTSSDQAPAYSVPLSSNIIG